jgi:hypothetical protein
MTTELSNAIGPSAKAGGTNLAPIAIFAFKRPQHTARTLAALARNPEFLQSPLYIFCDGARRPDEAAAVEATREAVRAIEHPNKVIVEAERNKGLANSIIHGVGHLCDSYGRVIVVEDDLVVSECFLHYMNGALDRYANDERVMQISGHMFPVSLEDRGESVLLPFITSWGWATWQRAWHSFDPNMQGYESLKSSRALRHKFDLDGAFPYYSMLNRQRRGEIDSWAIRWYLTCFQRGGLTLYPTSSLVDNIGFDGSGTHCDVRESIEQIVFRNAPISRFPSSDIDVTAYTRVKQHLAAENSLFQRIYRRLKQAI